MTIFGTVKLDAPSESRILPLPAKVSRSSFSVKSAPAAGKPSGPPIKLPYAGRRSRKYLTLAEVNAMIDAAKEVGRHGARDALLILMAYRHALRVGEVVNLQWDQADLDGGKLHVNRLKNGDPLGPLP